MYESLRKVGFTADDVERVMSATVCLGGDLYDALDWLCLNLPNGKYFTVLFCASVFMLLIS